MNVKRLSEMQKVLDDRIMKEHGLENKDLEENKILALLVEISELANETRCFKHWSKKGPSEESIILEEYVDSSTFSSSIANHHQYDVDRLYSQYLSEFNPNDNPETLVTAFKDIMTKILKMEVNPDRYHYIDAFSAYLTIGKMLGFSWEKIEQAYVRKNAINHNRQDNGY